jgi:hypothetical protein
MHDHDGASDAATFKKLVAPLARDHDGLHLPLLLHPASLRPISLRTKANDLKWEWQLNRRKKSNNRDSTLKRCTQSVVLAGPPRPESTIVIVVLWLSVRTWNRTTEQDHDSDHA